VNKILLVLSLVCAACGSATYQPPQVIYVTVPVPSGSGPIGPAELQRASDSATNTAVAVSAQLTQDARVATANAATAAVAAARTTASHNATQDALQGQQTAVVLSLTQGAGQALATNAASVRTAEADQTAAAGTPTAQSLMVAVAATGTQLARTAETAVRRQALDDQVAAARGWLLLSVGVLFLLGLGAALVFGLSDAFSARSEMLRAQAARAQAEAMQLWIMQYGGVLLQLRQGQWERMETAQIAAPAGSLVENTSPAIREVPVRSHGEVVSSIQLGEPETPERLKVLHLLTQAVSIVGPAANAIPSAPALGLHPQEWQDAVNLLKAGPDRLGYVVTSTGRPKAGAVGRTRLVQPAYTTIGALLDGLKRGEVMPLPPPPKPVEAA